MRTIARYLLVASVLLSSLNLGCYVRRDRYYRGPDRGYYRGR